MNVTSFTTNTMIFSRNLKVIKRVQAKEILRGEKRSEGMRAGEISTLLVIFFYWWRGEGDNKKQVWIAYKKLRLNLGFWWVPQLQKCGLTLSKHNKSVFQPNLSCTHKTKHPLKDLDYAMLLHCLHLISFSFVFFL